MPLKTITDKDGMYFLTSTFVDNYAGGKGLLNTILAW